MPDPFATALGVLLNAPGSVAGDYLPVSGGSYSIRAIRQQPDQDMHFKIGSAVVGTNELTIALSDIPGRPAKGDRFVLDDQTSLTVLAPGKIDSEGLSWTVQFG